MAETVNTLLKPKALQTGDTVAVISPAAPTENTAQVFKQGETVLDRWGLKLKLMPNAANAMHYLAGDDEARLADLHAAFEDPSINGILCARGGYGCARLLSKVNFDLIQTNPKIFMGFSDITSLLLPFYERVGLVGFYAPMLTSNLVDNEPFHEENLFPLVMGQKIPPIVIANENDYTCIHASREAQVEAPLIGGNLTLLASLCGTPFQPNTAGHILFIEDWKEQYYSLDRQFQQLKLSGMLDNIAALVLCDFSQILNAFEGYPLEALFTDLFKDLACPVGFGLTVGHGDKTATLPIGVKARFDAASGQLCLLESPVLTD